MTNKRTPAPWTVNIIWAQSCGDGFSIQEQKGDEYSEEAKANAQLIAAAPELLEALKEIVKCEINRNKDLNTLAKRPDVLIRFSTERIAQAQAAINKAEGK